MVYSDDEDDALALGDAGDDGGVAAYATVGGAERLLSTATGGALIGYGLMRRSVGGAALAAAGTALLIHGMRRHSAVYHALGLTQNEEDARFWSTPFTRDVHARVVMTINRSAEDLYRAWRDFANHPRFFRHLESVEVRADRSSHWQAHGPMGRTIEWDAEITADEPERRIAWRSVNSTLFDHSGEVRFSELSPSGRGEIGRGTRVAVEFRWSPPAGAVGATVARLLPQDPQREVREGLRRFKQFMETGEIATGEMRCTHNEESAPV